MSKDSVIRILRYADMDRRELTKPRGSHADVSASVKDILEAVRTEGDAALLRFTERFDHVKLEALSVSEQEWEEGLAELNRKDSETCCEIACGFAFGEKGFDLDEVFAEADRLMYEDKKAKKQRAGQGAGR